MHKSRYCWQPSFAFVPDSLKATRKGYEFALMDGWDRHQDKWVGNSSKIDL